MATQNPLGPLTAQHWHCCCFWSISCTHIGLHYDGYLFLIIAHKNTFFSWVQTPVYVWAWMLMFIMTWFIHSFRKNERDKLIWNTEAIDFNSSHYFASQSSTERPRRAREERWPSLDCVTSEWALFMRLPACHSHITMNCEQDFGDGGLGVTLTLRLLMHGKVGSRSHCLRIN